MRQLRPYSCCLMFIGIGNLLPACDLAAVEDADRAGEGSAALAQPLGSESEPNNAAAQATPIGTDVVVRANIYQTAADVDLFSFQGAAGDRVYAATMTAF